MSLAERFAQITEIEKNIGGEKGRQHEVRFQSQPNDFKPLDLIALDPTWADGAQAETG